MGVKSNKVAKLTLTGSILFSIGTMLAVFQNCGSFDLSTNNPLFEQNMSSSCLGINCAMDLNMAVIRSGNTSVLIDVPTGSADCDSSNCVDVGGFCETGGYAKSVFIYEWQITDQPNGAPERSTVACDDNGRFQLQVRVPPNYDYTKINHLHVYMLVTDEKGREQLAPTGGTSLKFILSTRPPPVGI